MKEEWLMPGAIVPVTPETVVALINEIKHLIGMLGEAKLEAQDRIDRLYVMYEQACQQRDALMDQQQAQIEAMRGRIQ